MVDNSGKKNSADKLGVPRIRRAQLWALAGAVLVLLAGWVIWRLYNRGELAAMGAKLQALPQSPAWDRLVFLGFVVLAVLGVAVLWKVPQWQVAREKGLSRKEQFDKRNEARKTLATILGGVAFLTGGFFTWRNFNLAQESLRVSQQGQITDRFTKAMEQLGAVDSQGKPRFEVRLGGIYSLEAIARESKDLHWPIMEVLCSYVRGNAPAQPPANAASAGQKKKSGSEGTTSQQEVHPRADIQAVLTVLGRRDASQENENQLLDLSGTNLAGADLRKAHLTRADFTEADLRGADLREADLREADLREADLREADLREADLRGAFLYVGDLREADLSVANLGGADLSGADLSGADFHRGEPRRGGPRLGGPQRGETSAGRTSAEPGISLRNK